MLRIPIFILFSLGLILYSRSSLRNRRSHGFYRFFAWEAILGLFLLNTPAWFRDPFSLAQMISWLLLLGSLLLATHGFWLLRHIGQPQGELEATTRLVRVGAYRYIRHPLYASLLLLAWGAFFKDISLLGGLLALLVSLFLYLTARAEEREMLDKFGTEYAGYMQNTRRFVPFLF